MKLFTSYSFFCLPSLLLFFLLLQTSTCDADLIEDVCRRASADSPNIDFWACVSAFRSDPKSLNADLPGLCIISVQLAYANATLTESCIHNMLATGRFDSYDTERLKSCLELYSDAIACLGDSLKAIDERRLGDANIWISAVMDDAVTCEDGFMEEAGRKSPLTRENGALVQLTAISLAITDMPEA